MSRVANAPRRGFRTVDTRRIFLCLPAFKTSFSATMPSGATAKASVRTVPNPTPPFTARRATASEPRGRRRDRHGAIADEKTRNVQATRFAREAVPAGVRERLVRSTRDEKRCWGSPFRKTNATAAAAAKPALGAAFTNLTKLAARTTPRRCMWCIVEHEAMARAIAPSRPRCARPCPARPSSLPSRRRR